MAVQGIREKQNVSKQAEKGVISKKCGGGGPMMMTGGGGIVARGEGGRANRTK